MGDVGKIRAELNVAVEGLGRAQSSVVAAVTNANRVHKRAVQSGFRGVAAGMSRAIQQLKRAQQALADVLTGAEGAVSIVGRVNEDMSPADIIATMTHACDKIHTARSRTASLISGLDDVRAQIAEVLRGGRPEPMIAIVDQAVHALRPVIGAMEMAARQAEEACAEARQIGSLSPGDKGRNPSPHDAGARSGAADAGLLAGSTSVVTPVPEPAADAAATEQATRAAARLNTALTANRLAGDPMFNGLDPQSAGKVATALSDWPRAIPTPLRARMVSWARDGCGGNARELANRVEFARARYRELYEQALRDLAGTTPPGQLVKAARRATVTALDREAGWEGMSATLGSDLATIAAAPRLGQLPPGIAAVDVPPAIRALPALPWESGTAEAYHARKHQTELPVEEQKPGNPVRAFAASLHETVRSGTIVRDRPVGTSRQLIFHRVASPTLTLEAIVYVRADGSVVIATYGKAKAR